jgi:hypothetical protein
MSTVVMHNVVSVDGFIADADDQVGPLFDWYNNGDVPLDETAWRRSRRSRPTTSSRHWRASGYWWWDVKCSTSPTAGRASRRRATTW